MYQVIVDLAVIIGDAMRGEGARVGLLGSAMSVVLATLALAACSGEDSRSASPDSIVHDGSDAAVAPAPTTGATVVEATEVSPTVAPAPSSEETVVPATAEVPAYLGCERMHDCVLEHFQDVWGGYSAVHSTGNVHGKIILYFYTGAIYPDDEHVEWDKAREYLREAERVLPIIERRMGVSFTGDLHIMIYENWNAMKHFAPDPDIELPSLILGKGALVINHDHDDVVSTIQSEISFMVWAEIILMVWEAISADVAADREEGSDMAEREPESAPMQPLDDAGSCVAGSFSCFTVVGVDDCLKLRAYPSSEGEVLDCVPNGTRLAEKLRDYGPLKRENNTVWRFFTADDGEWLGWAEERFLQGFGKRPKLNPGRIPLRAPADADACILGDHLPGGYCIAVTGADDCLKLWAYPSFEGEVLDCVPDGTKLFRQGGGLKREGELAWYSVGAADGQWLGWAEWRFLRDVRPLNLQRSKLISLRTSTDVDICIPGDSLSFRDPEPDFQYGSFSCLAVMGVDDCLKVRETPSSDGRQLDCVPDGTKFIVPEPRRGIDDIAAEDTDGVVWRLVRWGDGREAGWVNNHHLDGPPPNRMVAVVSHPVPAVEFPDDIALIASPYPDAGVGRGWWPSELVRIYQRPGHGLVSETLFHANSFYWTADGTVLGGYVCSEDSDPMSWVCTAGETVHYESKDGGITLERFGLFFQTSDDYLSDYIGDDILFADDIDLRISDQLRFLPDGSTTYETWDLLGGVAQGVYEPYIYLGEFLPGHRFHWPTIQNVETGEEWPVVFPEDVLRLGDSFLPRLVLRGPFLRVVDVGDGCLPIRAGASPDAGGLDCMAERVLLQDQGGDVITDDSVTWRKVKTPAGVVGWADDRYLE